MARKKISTTKSVLDPDEQANAEEAPKQESSDTVKQKPVTDDQHQLIIERGVADKLSPKSAGKIYFQLSRSHEDEELFLRIDGNDGGGLHSREWINLQIVIDTISTQSDRAFKSTLLKSCMKGKSSNNTSFLAAILRSPEIGLIKASEKNAFLHLLVDDFENVAAALLQRPSE